MKRIDEIDRAMAVNNRVTDPDVVWYDSHDEPFSLHGFCSAEKGDLFRRVPLDVAEATSSGVATLSVHTAGGRVRFATDSDYVAIHADISVYSPMDHMPFTGIFGFDMYVEQNGIDTYAGTFRPGLKMENGYESKLPLPGAGMRQVTINFPLYNQVDNLLIGVKEGSAIEAHRPYAYQVPVVYYGSSITQGGCASRPGNSYQSMITRMLDCDHINLGFSGSAKGEDAITNYMAGLKMSVFVCDYDHNAPNPEHLRATHSKLYHTVRAANPDLPILFVSMIPIWNDMKEQVAERKQIILDTYNEALAAGDKNVAFLDGETLFEGEMFDSCTVDGCHPNDLGFYRMAQGIAPLVKAMLDK